jgi:WD40 repeat protein
MVSADGKTAEAVGLRFDVDDELWSLSVDGDGERLAVGTQRGAVRFYDLALRRSIGLPIAGHDYRCLNKPSFSECLVWSIDFHPRDGDLLVSATPAAGALAWQVDTESLVSAACERANRNDWMGDLYGVPDRQGWRACVPSATDTTPAP